MKLKICIMISKISAVFYAYDLYMCERRIEQRAWIHTMLIIAHKRSFSVPRSAWTTIVYSVHALYIIQGMNILLLRVNEWQSEDHRHNHRDCNRVPLVYAPTVGRILHTQCQ